MALVTKEIAASPRVVNGLNLPILLLAGVLLPISIGPEWMRVLAPLQPALLPRHGRGRSLAVGTFTGGAIWQAFAVLVPLCALAARMGDARLPPRRGLVRSAGCMHPAGGRRMRRPPCRRMRRHASFTQYPYPPPVLVELLVVVVVEDFVIFDPLGLTTKKPFTPSPLVGLLDVSETNV